MTPFHLRRRARNLVRRVLGPTEPPRPAPVTPRPVEPLRPPSTPRPMAAPMPPPAADLPPGRLWYQVCSLDSLVEGEGRAVQALGHRFALFRIGDEVHALAPVCPQGSGRLAEGSVEGGRLRCPDHDHSFALDSGAGDAEGEQIEVAPVRLSAGRVLVGLPG